MVYKRVLCPHGVRVSRIADPTPSISQADLEIDCSPNPLFRSTLLVRRASDKALTSSARNRRQAFMEVHALIVMEAEVLGRTISCCWRLPQLRILCLEVHSGCLTRVLGCSREGFPQNSRRPQPVKSKRNGEAPSLEKGRGDHFGIGPIFTLGVCSFERIGYGFSV
jgi:hypothetical protein